MSGVRSLARTTTTAGSSASASASASRAREEIEEEDVEDDDGSDEDEDFNNGNGEDYPRVARNGRDVNGRTASQITATLSPAEGLMLLPADDTCRTLAPSELLPILARLIKDERLPIRSQYLYRLLQNIAKKPLLRDAILRLLVCLLIEDKEGASNVVKELTNNSKIEFNFTTDDDNDDNGNNNNNNNNNSIIKNNINSKIDIINKRAFAVPNKLSKGKKGLSQLSSSRLVAVLFHLSSANVSCVYDLLRPRIRKGGPVLNRNIEITKTEYKSIGKEKEKEKEKEKDENNIGNDNKNIEKSSENVVKNDENISMNENVENMITKEVEKEDHIEGRSTESLLELLMPLFGHVNFNSNGNDLTELSVFINVVSTPLEFLSEAVEENSMVRFSL